MIGPWTSTNGVELPDLVPCDLRRDWLRRGLCPGRSLYALFHEQVRAHPRRQAVIGPDGAVDYGRLDAMALRIADALIAAGLGPRDIIATSLPNGWRAIATDLAIAAIGAVALPFPAGRGRLDAMAVVRTARASALVTADADAHGVRLAANLTALRDDLPELREMLVFGETPSGCRPLDPWLDERLDDWLAEGGQATRGRLPREVDASTPARIMLSSGTEATPKLVAYAHDAMAGGRGNYVGALRHGVEVPRALVMVPFASSYGSLALVLLVRHGGTVVTHDGFDPVVALAALTTRRPSHLVGVPTMLRRMAELPRPSNEDLSALRLVVSSGAPLPAATLDACLKRFGRPVVNVYGSTDGVNCHTTRWEVADDEARVGLPSPAVADIRVVDEEGRALPPGRVGEVQARGPMTPLCYVGDPELNERYRTRDGWVRTGDRGRLAADGQLWLVDRIKQVVIRGGYTISLAEVESHAAAHPAITEAACVGIPDDDLGERLCLCVAQRVGTTVLTLAEINAFLEEERGLERRKLP
jgi:acyl-CoA synthetase (AMP-forming)/AMP-acid ligase II